MPMGEVPARAHQELEIRRAAGHRLPSRRALDERDRWLRRQGFEKAQSLRGGIDAWSREVDPSVARY